MIIMLHLNVAPREWYEKAPRGKGAKVIADPSWFLFKTNSGPRKKNLIAYSLK